MWHCDRNRKHDGGRKKLKDLKSAQDKKQWREEKDGFLDKIKDGKIAVGKGKTATSVEITRSSSLQNVEYWDFMPEDYCHENGVLVADDMWAEHSIKGTTMKGALQCLRVISPATAAY